MSRSRSFLFLLASCSLAFLSSCSTAKKERLQQREKIANSSGLYCDFINGEKFNDVEIVMNLEMGKRCDTSKPFSISGYKSTAEVTGMMYCCSIAKKPEPPTRSASPAGRGGSAGTPTPDSGKGASPTSGKPGADPLVEEVISE